MKQLNLHGYLLKIDDRDYHFVKDQVLCLNKGKYNHGWYAMYGVRLGKYVKKMYIHRLVAGAKKGDRVTFRSTDTLDCRRKNLRLNGKAL